MYPYISLLEKIIIYNIMYIKRLAIKEVSWKYTNHIGLGSNIGATDKIGK